MIPGRGVQLRMLGSRSVLYRIRAMLYIGAEHG